MVFAALLSASLPAPVHASPDVPMCIADQPRGSVAPIDLVQWRAPMCGPYVSAFPFADAQPTRRRAIEAYRTAIRADRGCELRRGAPAARSGPSRAPSIRDRIALQSARLELLRGRPERAAEFFAEASQSPHESVRVEARFGQVLALLRASDPAADQALDDLLVDLPLEFPIEASFSSSRPRACCAEDATDEAIAVMHAVRVDHPGSRIAPWADSELARLAALGHDDACDDRR